MILTQRFQFAASHAHHGTMHEAQHHHDAITLEIKVDGDLNEEMYVIDFHRIDALVREKVIRQLDGRNLNELFDYPTSEALAIWAWRQLRTDLPLCEVSIFEMPHVGATYRGEYE